MNNKSNLLSSDEDIEFLNSLKRDFYDETQDSIEKAESMLLKFEETNDELVLLDYKRILHSIKGSAKAVDESEFALLVHKIEDYIQKEKTPQFFEIQFSFIDFCKNYISLLKNNDQTESQELLKNFCCKI